ncbi:NADH-ubiquinone oxidoreductase chain G [hydrothermal vent metagenome]|uniref:NADH-ubiquinone oxidoreductase chain G n=1 Tax=hydrothermal vent metagenome TaxID=652676 RepID=A0A1W1EIF1_9ZZZZ
MMKKNIKVTIDGKEYSSEYGKTILEIARANGVYIPTMCYLTKTLPIASCRMCVVAVEGVDGLILSCQEKAVDGAVINTQNEQLHKERTNIMKLYNVNHPLECGVCDKSGECELQNKTMEHGLTHQNFTTKDIHRPVQNWGTVSYDPALCIMCERCVKVSTEITGDEALQVKFGGYNSTIINNKQDKNYKSLGEAAAVCPVGALVDSNFKYTANAWELKQIPSSCPHCGGGHDVIYEVKDDRVYRVSNHAEFSTLCPSSRYGYDFENRGVTKDIGAFNRAIEAFNSAKTIIFSNEISNEEAFILQQLKEKRGYRLISPQAKAYQDFMSAYSSITGKSLFSASLDSIKSSRAVLVVGSRINDDAPIIKYAINTASKHNRARVIYMHPIEDEEISNIVTQFIKYEPTSEEMVLALLVDTLLKDVDLPDSISKVIKDFDIGSLSAESNVSEEELEVLKKSLIKLQGLSLVVGADLYSHPRAKNIAKMVGLIDKYSDFNVMIVPPTGNAMGISKICELDDEIEGATIGINVKGDFTLSAYGENDLDLPALNQQEGTLVGFNKRVVPLNVAISYGGYTLNDISNELGLKAKFTINYTKVLPTTAGFKSIEFDELEDYFDNVGNEFRGYLLDDVSVEVDENIEEPNISDGIDGAVIYNCNPSEHTSPFTNVTKLLKSEAYLVGSKQFAQVSKLNDGDTFNFNIGDIEFQRVFKIDTSLKGIIALNPTYDRGLSEALLSSYRYNRLEIEKEV